MDNGKGCGLNKDVEKSECFNAAKELGYTIKEDLNASNWNDKPPGCVVNVKLESIYFNGHSEGKLGNEDFISICKDPNFVRKYLIKEQKY